MNPLLLAHLRRCIETLQERMVSGSSIPPSADPQHHPRLIRHQDLDGLQQIHETLLHPDPSLETLLNSENTFSNHRTFLGLLLDHALLDPEHLEHWIQKGAHPYQITQRNSPLMHAAARYPDTETDSRAIIAILYQSVQQALRTNTITLTHYHHILYHAALRAQETDNVPVLQFLMHQKPDLDPESLADLTYSAFLKQQNSTTPLSGSQFREIIA